MNVETEATLHIMPGATLDGSRLSISGGSDAGVYRGTVLNSGILKMQGSDASGTLSIGSTNLVNDGVIQIDHGRLYFTNALSPKMPARRSL